MNTEKGTAPSRRPWYIKPREPHEYQHHTYSGHWYNRTTILSSPKGQYSRRHVIATVARGNGRECANAALLTVAPDLLEYGAEVSAFLTHMLATYGLEESFQKETRSKIEKWKRLRRKMEKWKKICEDAGKTKGELEQ